MAQVSAWAIAPAYSCTGRGGNGGGTPAVTAALFAPVSGAQVDNTTLLYATPSAPQLALISNP